MGDSHSPLSVHGRVRIRCLEVGMLERFLPAVYADREQCVVPGKSALDVLPAVRDLYDRGQLWRHGSLKALPAS